MSAWISLVTPVSYHIGRPLAEGPSQSGGGDERSRQSLMPHQTLSVRDAIRKAVHRTRENHIDTRWSIAGPIPGDPEWAGGTTFEDKRSITIQADRADVFRAILRIWVGHGWYAGDILWRLRGWMDQIVGGPGLRRGRASPEQDRVRRVSRFLARGRH